MLNQNVQMPYYLLSALEMKRLIETLLKLYLKQTIFQLLSHGKVADKLDVVGDFVAQQRQTSQLPWSLLLGIEVIN